MIITIKNRLGTEVLNRISNFEALRFETDRIGGDLTAEFAAKRNILAAQYDLQMFNQIFIEEGASTAWEGFVSSPVKTSPATLSVSCQGWTGLLAGVPVTAEQPSQKMSDLITAMLANSRVSPFLTAGSINPNDYTAPATTDVLPGKSCADLLEAYNKWNDWRYYTSEGQRFNFGPPQTIAKWIVLAKDAGPGFQISDSLDNFWNEIIYEYSTNGTNKLYGSVSDAASILKYGRTVSKIITIPGTVTAPHALHYANIYLSRGKDMTVMGQIVTSIVYDATTNLLAPLWKVKGGDPIKVQDFLAPLGSIGNVVDEITTFEMKTVQYDHKAYTITITPKDWDSGLEPTFAKLGG